MKFNSSLISAESIRTIKLKKQIFYSFLLKSISIIINLLYVPLLLDFLDNERYGIWLTISSIILWFSFFDIGLGNGLRNKLTEALAHKKYLLSKEYISTTYALLSIIFLSLIALFFLINPFLNWSKILNTTVVNERELTLVAAISFSLFLLRFIFQTIGKIYLAFQRPSINNIFGPLSNLLSFITIFILLKVSSNGNLIVLSAILSISPIVVLIFFTCVAFYKSYNFIRPSFKFINFEHSKELLTLGSKFLLIQVAGLLMFTSSNLIITQLFGPEDVTEYNIVHKYFQVPIMIFSIITTPIWSSVTDAYALKDYKWLKKTLKTLKLISAAFIIAVIVMFLMSSIIYDMWLKDRIEISLSMTFVFAILTIMKIFQMPYTNYINGLGKLKISTYIVIFIIISYIPLAILLARYLNDPAGVVLATCFLSCIGLIIQPIQVKKLVNLKAEGIWGQ